MLATDHKYIVYNSYILKLSHKNNSTKLQNIALYKIIALNSGTEMFAKARFNVTSEM